MLDAKLRINRRERKENVKHKPVIESADLLRIKSSEFTSVNNPAGLQRRFTHSVRATAISLWSDADIPDRHITFVSGHSNEQSLAHYSSLPSGPQLRKFSDTISNALGNGSSLRAESSSTTTVISPSKTSAPAPALTCTTTSNSMAVNSSLSMNVFPSGFFSSCNIANVQVYLGSQARFEEK
ncbi:hypothetical protein OS493_037023 [Desmophyllum pertusum]|uniref:Uncharacterized protein n=1 Tax=Desmophyllum pertusum TaxID=174260 RepID=A0A9W9YI58_9CNID|nr:hypothetical protein OS493_037023 [Desmophyllum pertusum]